VNGLSFTDDGLEPFLQSARTNYLVGTGYDGCKRSQEAKRKFQAAASATAADELLWASLASRKLSMIDGQRWRERLESALVQLKHRSESSSYPGWWDYSAGAIALALGHDEEANRLFRKA